MFKKIEKEKVQMTCPLCRADINEVWVCKLDSVIGVRYAYFCSGCQKMLSINKKKGIYVMPHDLKKINVTKDILN
ncbi:MAG TPA: hypothetical protein PKA80_14040 [Ignavibacteriaceae bacterium]|nr:hypothetical protein [Ignavibacteriaceae bacterium]